jgi:RNA polymerase sigma-70 factor (ECF subfamily)
MREAPFVRNYAAHLTRDRVEAEELAQHALFLIWRGQNGFELGTDFRSWAARITRNAFYTSHRRDRWHADMAPELAERTLVAPDDPAAAAEFSDVRGAIGRLSDEHRDILLRAAAGTSYDELSFILGCPLGTVRSRLSRARAALHRLLAEAEVCEPGRLLDGNQTLAV